MFTVKFLEAATQYHLDRVHQNLVTWPHIAARGARKHSLYSYHHVLIKNWGPTGIKDSTMRGEAGASS